MYRRFKFWALVLFLAAGLVAVAGLDRELNRALILSDKELSAEGVLLLKVARGQTLSTLIVELQQRGILERTLPIKLFIKFTGRDSIRAGEYAIYRGETPLSLLEKLEKGEIVQYRITFPEGWTLQQWRALLAGETRIGHPGAELSLEELADYLGIAQDNPEGWFAADTYYFGSGDSDLDILQQAYRAMLAILQDQWQERQEQLPYQNPYDALIMASIVERETGLAAEREQISGVFVRRLRKGMRLQTDPTVIYGLGERFQGNLTRRHLREATPYNTYVIDGLPPTPIANPGKEAIRAALHPAEGDSLYFVARGDGSHYFSASLAEHQAAVRRYQLAGRKRSGYRSSPAQQ